MKKVCFFSQIVNEGYWMSGSKSALKVMISKQHKPGGNGDLEDIIKKYA